MSTTKTIIKLAIARSNPNEPDIQISLAALFELGAEELIDEFIRKNYQPGQGGAVGVSKEALAPFIDPPSRPKTSKKTKAKAVAPETTEADG